MNEEKMKNFMFNGKKFEELPERVRENIERELALTRQHEPVMPNDANVIQPSTLYDWSDLQMLQSIPPPVHNINTALQTLDDLMKRDQQREEDGFPRRIRLGKIVKPVPGKPDQVIVVPTTTEPKFHHDSSITEEDETGGSGEGEEGEVIGESPAEPQPGEGEGQGAGQGEGGSHEIGTDAFDLGRIITEKFHLPNLKNKGKKRAFSKYTYDLTDRNRSFGQVLDKMATLKRVVQTNIQLGNIDPDGGDINTENLLIDPKDHIYRILSKEKDFETQAVVFFVRDYSGSMEGEPTQTIVSQHLLIYSWLLYQYQNNVMTRFILHDTNAKEVPDFHTYYKALVAGGTNIFPAYELVNKIIEEEQLAKDYNIYIFHGTDGDDWDNDGEKMLAQLRKMFVYANRIGITIAKNNWSGGSETTVEKYLMKSGLLKEKPELLRLDVMTASQANEERIVESIKKLIS